MSPSQDADDTRALAIELHELTKNRGDAALSDIEQRSRLRTLSHKLAFSLEPPEDIVIRQAFMNNVNMCVRVCTDLGVFKILASSSAPMSVSALAKATMAEEQLLVRLMRAVAGINFVEETDLNVYQANKVTHAIASPALDSGFGVAFDNSARPKSNLWEFVKYLRSNNYTTPRDPKAGPYQLANDCVGLSAFEHWMRDPIEAVRFNTFMHGVRGSRPTWVKWFPITTLLDSEKAVLAKDSVLLVDVAGGHGHQLHEFTKKYPELIGRVILQDLLPVLEEVSDLDLDPRIEKQAIDFFASQPAPGAKFYVLSYIMHDWPDKECESILANVRDAMTPGYSRILINDSILPDRNCPPVASAFDVTMMCHHTGIERTELMWRDLISAVPGLELVRLWHPPAQGEGVVEVMKTK